MLFLRPTSAMKIYRTSYDSPLGELTLASDGEAIIGLWLENQKHWGAKLLDESIIQPDLAVFDDCARWLDRYFDGERPSPNELSLAPIGSAFQQKVWAQLCQIPYGATTTYGDLAQRLHSSPRAVGGAVGHNPISIIIPCHRVVGSQGQITGYAGGVERKRWLLEFEKSQ